MEEVEEIKLEVLELQEERAVAYNYFETGFRQLLDDSEEEAYQKICQSVTTKFKQVSQGMNEKLAKLKLLNCPSAEALSSWVRKLQAAEKDKLHLTIATHVERKRADHYRKSVEEEAKHAKEHGMKECSCRKAAAARMPDEFNVHEQEKTVKAMHQSMDELISTINECLDEIRYLEA